MLCLSCAKVYSRVNAVNQVVNERQNPYPPGAYILVNVNIFFCLMKKNEFRFSSRHFSALKYIISIERDSLSRIKSNKA